jgi:hypothetical protein
MRGRVTSRCLRGNQLRAIHRLTDVKPGPPPRALGTFISGVLLVALAGCSSGSDQAHPPAPDQPAGPRSEPENPRVVQKESSTHRAVLVYASHRAVPIRRTGRFVWHSKTLAPSVGTPTGEVLFSYRFVNAQGDGNARTVQLRDGRTQMIFRYHVANFSPGAHLQIIQAEARPASR